MANWFGRSTGDSGKGDLKDDSTWNPGASSSKKRINKGHKPRAGKAAMRKAKHHYGSGGGA